MGLLIVSFPRQVLEQVELVWNSTPGNIEALTVMPIVRIHGEIEALKQKAGKSHSKVNRANGKNSMTVR